VRRGDRHEARVPAGAERLPPVASQQEGACEQEGDHRLPAILRELRDRRHVLHPGVGDHHVQAAEAVESRLNRAPIALARGEIGGVTDSWTVSRGIQVDGQHIEAVLLEALADRSADPACRTGHDGGPPLAGALHHPRL
jgi:hypothetical protein